MNTKIIKFDINKNLYDTLIAKQGDTKSRFLLFNLLDGSIPFSLENRSVRVYAIKPDGTEIFNDLIITDAAKGYCILELTTQMLAVAGTVKLELMVIEDEKKLTSNIFYMDVKKSINSEKAVVSTNEFGALLTALSSLNEYDNYKKEIAAARDGEANLLTKVKKIDEQLDTKANLVDVFLKEKGININDFDEETRRTFLENQGIDVNYVLGEGNVKPNNTSFMKRKNLYDNKTINNLGVNNSGTLYPVTGGYASDYINIGGYSKLYSKLIDRIAFYREDDTFINVSIKNNTFTEVAIPKDAFKIKYSVSKSDIANAFIVLTNEELIVEEMGYKLPISNLSDNEFRAKMKEFGNVIKVTNDNCDFFNSPINLYDNKSVNDLGVNTSGTNYPVTGGYARNNIEIGTNKYIYPSKINIIALFDESNKLISVITGNDFRKIDLPNNCKTFSYSVAPDNISVASIYLVDYELSENPPLPKLKTEYLNMNDIRTNLKPSYNTTIACYGDSLTEGAGSTNAGVYSYPAQLQNLINERANIAVTALNRGIGGNTSLPICYKSGCYADMVNPFTIPSNTTPVEITKTGYLANKVNGTPSIRNGVNPVTINGIQGELSYSDNTYKFARLTPGEEIKVNRPTQILPYASQSDKGAILIICIGTNDSEKEETDYPPKLIQRIRRMIDYLQSNQYIIIGLTTANRQNVNTALEKEFGANYFDVFNYIIEYGLQDNNLTPTSDDLEDISKGILPRQLMHDQIHYNNYGYYSKAMGIYLKGKDLGYWE